MMFNEELFLSICSEYGLDDAPKHDDVMIRTKEGLVGLDDFAVDSILKGEPKVSIVRSMNSNRFYNYNDFAMAC